MKEGHAPDRCALVPAVGVHAVLLPAMRLMAVLPTRRVPVAPASDAALPPDP